MLNVLWSVAGFIVAIGVLVSFHEFGHFWVARRCGVRVLRFSVGFGKPLWLRRGKDGVEYAISAIPLGGYVRMLDEREAPVDPAEQHRAFNRQPPGRRALILAAGPLANFLFAVVAYWGVYVLGVEGLKPLVEAPKEGTVAAAAGLARGDQVLSIGGTEVPTWQVLRAELIDRALDRMPVALTVRDPRGRERVVTLDMTAVRVDPELLFLDLGLTPFQPPIPPVLSEIEQNGPADQAGFVVGDRIVSRDGTAVASWQDWVDWLQAHPREIAKVTVQRAGGTRELTLIVGTKTRDAKEIGKFGAGIDPPRDLWQDLRAEHRLGLLAALPAAVAQTWQMSWLTLKLLYRMVLGDVSVKNVSGPIQIAQYAGYSASIGLAPFLNFLAIVSVSLFVLNLLPVPVLDGGHLLFCAIESVKGSPVSERAQAIGTRFGVTMLVLLMGLAFYNDIMRLIG